MDRKTLVRRKQGRAEALAEDEIYIGRPSIFGNPYQISKDMPREEVIRGFTNDLFRKHAWLFHKIPALAGKTLVCWCHPEACHGDVLAALADMSEHLLPPGYNPDFDHDDDAQQSPVNAYWLPEDIALEVWTRSAEGNEWMFFIGGSWAGSTDLYTAITGAIEEWIKDGRKP